MIKLIIYTIFCLDCVNYLHLRGTEESTNILSFVLIELEGAHMDRDFSSAQICAHGRERRKMCIYLCCVYICVTCIVLECFITAFVLCDCFIEYYCYFFSDGEFICYFTFIEFSWISSLAIDIWFVDCFSSHVKNCCYYNYRCVRAQ